MRRRWLLALGAYVLAAVVTTATEARGGTEVRGGGRQCGCPAECWCRRPALRLFRWVAPFGHRSVDPTEKQAMAHG